MNTHEAILEAAVRVFAEVGSRGATTRRIAEEAGVNEVTLFRHFGSKETMLTEPLEWVAQRVEIAALPAEPSDALAELAPWCTDHIRSLYQARARTAQALCSREIMMRDRRLHSRVGRRDGCDRVVRAQWQAAPPEPAASADVGHRCRC
ncbi:MAG: TetR/AcrR family transcriptional regulator [Gemmatimonadetes bacterium]|nr:TetR/AcrR family transcriptional regulator [Gemmatimonadota bacterium]